LYPTLKLGQHWFGYAAVQVRETPYFFYDAFEPEHETYAHALQGYLGYKTSVRGAALTIKGGQMLSAFGAFPLRYDDNENPLLDQPLAFSTHVRIRPDQLPCSTVDLKSGSNFAVPINYKCGGAVGGEHEGVEPGSLYGLLGIQADFSFSNFDSRVQITSSSPANRLDITKDSHHAQWAAGAGYTLRHQLRLGVSGYTGPYLQKPVEALLPAGKTVRDFPASAIGLDAQWARGRWSLAGEWQHFVFRQPNFTRHPTVRAYYVEAKTILTPRIHTAFRIAWLDYGAVRDKAGTVADPIFSGRRTYELGGGYRLSRLHLIKASYEWVRRARAGALPDDVFGVQWVTTIPPLSKVFR
jgi:hypothetical protein